MLNGISNQKSSQGQGKNNLIFLILILGMFSIVSIGIIVVTVVKRIRPDVFAAPGIYKTLNYQGKLEDSGGITVPDGAYNIKFTIYDAAAAGNVLWTARESDACGAPFNPSAKSVTTSLGVFSTQLGESGDCPVNLDFNTDSYYLGITVGADSEMTPRKRIGAAGYAFNADLLDGLNTSLVGGASSFIPATDTSGNLVLTANITFDTTTFALDSTNDNIGIGTAAPDITRTLDLTTAKQYGIYSVSSAAINDVTAVYGSVTDVTNINKYGGYFTAAGTSGHGVFGEASGTGDSFIPNFGGYFTAAGDSGRGVYGEASASGVGITNFGGYFLASGGFGRGVYGLAFGTDGANYGGYFRANGPGGYGVYGWANEPTAANYGGYFKASGQGGYGVYGWADETTVANYGGYFKSDGADGYAVYGTATDTTGGTNYGGYFTAGEERARAVYGEATNATGTNYGGEFVANGEGGIGVSGTATSTAGTGTPYGGNFQSYGPGGYGVYGSADDTSAVINYGGYFYGRGTAEGTVGVYGLADAAAAVYGVRGEATSTGAGILNYGGYFTAAGGLARSVYAEATSATGGGYGVYSVAQGATGTAVFGQATGAAGASNVGGSFQASGDNGAFGVVAVANAATGANYGIYTNVISATGWAGYFSGGRGIYTLRLAINDAVSVVSYNTIGTAAASHTAGGEIEDQSDFFIADDLEVNGEAWFDGGHTDLAEMVAYSGEGEAGDVVVVDENNDNAAKLATKPYDQSVLGIISTKPSLIITGDIKEGKLLAVAGRVPTKVSNINGAIHRGDLLTTSSVHGRAMKATEAGPIVGKAMGECAEDECTIWVFLNVSWYGGAMAETMAVDSPTVSDSKTLFEPESLLDKLAAIWKKIIGR